jgi:hypothetical protein
MSSSTWGIRRAVQMAYSLRLYSGPCFRCMFGAPRNDNVSLHRSTFAQQYLELRSCNTSAVGSRASWPTFLRPLKPPRNTSRARGAFSA